MNWLLRASLFAAAIAMAAPAVLAQGSYTVGAPTVPGGGGTVTFKVRIPGVVPTVSTSDTNLITVHLTHASTAESKAAAIVTAINDYYGCPQTGPTLCASVDPAHPDRINLVTNNPREKDLDGHFLGGTIAITKESHSTEPVLMATINNAPGGLVPRPFGLIGFEGLPTGLNPAGGASTFTADFGYDGFDTTATVSFADLAAPTIDDLLMTMFNRLDAALPIGLAADLTLDLANQMISFEFPFGKTNYFVNVFSTDIGNGDTGVGAIGGLVEIPEPAPLAALVLAATAMLMRRRARA